MRRPLPKSPNLHMCAAILHIYMCTCDLYTCIYVCMYTCIYTHLKMSVYMHIACAVHIKKEFDPICQTPAWQERHVREDHPVLRGACHQRIYQATRLSASLSLSFIYLVSVLCVYIYILHTYRSRYLSIYLYLSICLFTYLSIYGGFHTFWLLVSPQMLF